MNGERVKQVLWEKRINVSQLARKLDMPSQNIFSVYNSPDVKTGILENIAAALGKDMSLWYEELAGVTINNTNSNNQAGRDISINAKPEDAAEIERLKAENANLLNQCRQLTDIITNLTRRPNP